MKTLWFLENVSLYNIICPPKYAEYKIDANVKMYKKSQYIYFEDDSADKLYLIDKGKVKIGNINDAGEETVLAILSEGDIFGEKVLIGEHTRKEFAQVMEQNTQVCPVPEHKMIDLMKKNTDFSLYVYKFLGFRFKKMERRVQLLLYKDARTRLTEFLKDLGEEFGYENIVTKDIVIKHPYSQQEIASLIGTSRPTLNLLMNQLKDEGYIGFERKFITIKKRFS